MHPFFRNSSKIQLFTCLLSGMFAVATFCGMPLTARAQARAGGLSGAAFAGAHGATAPRPAARIGTALNPNFGRLRGVPGLGFDYQHLAAVGRAPFHSQGLVAPVRTPSFHHRGAGFVLPVFDLGLPYYYYPDSGTPYGYDDEAPVPPVINAPTPLLAMPVPVENVGEEDASNLRSQTTRNPVAASVPELGRLILVRGDGQVILAVAFITQGNQLTYITTDGSRRSFPISQLDREATRQMNDATGTPVAIPN